MLQRVRRNHRSGASARLGSLSALTVLLTASSGWFVACGGTEDPGEVDADLDGYPAATDCNDNEAATNPGATELCDGKDNNCNGQADEGFSLTTYYADADGDGAGSQTSFTQACSQPSGYVTTSSDCDDANAGVKPGAAEVTCNGVDENCTGATDDHPDQDADGADTCPTGVAGADGYAIDCNDFSAQVSPNAIEQCNKLDDNCNGSIDEGLSQSTYYQDTDLDTFGNESVSIQDCAAPSGYTTVGGDCDDENNAVNPNASENIGDGVDSNCNGYSDAIETYGGTGTAGYGGDGGPVTAASFNMPSSITVDLQGNIFVADTNNHRIRKIDLTGLVTTFAGTGVAGSLGDKGQAANAQLNYPAYISADGAGNLLIADTMNHKIRSVTPNGIITTVAGAGTAGSSGDGGGASTALLNEPRGVTADPAGNIFISDSGNNRIRKVALGANRIITTFAGTGEAGYSGDGAAAISAMINHPIGITVDTGGNIMFADSKNHRIRRINPINGKIETYAGNGTAAYAGDFGSASAASLNEPSGLYSSPSSDLYVVDTLNHRVRRISSASRVITTVAGSGTPDYLGDGGLATLGSMNSPMGAILDSVGNLVIADTGNNVLREVIW